MQPVDGRHGQHCGDSVLHRSRQGAETGWCIVTSVVSLGAGWQHMRQGRWPCTACDPADRLKLAGAAGMRQYLTGTACRRSPPVAAGGRFDAKLPARPSGLGRHRPRRCRTAHGASSRAGVATVCMPSSAPCKGTPLQMRAYRALRRPLPNRGQAGPSHAQRHRRSALPMPTFCIGTDAARDAENGHAGPHRRGRA